MGDTGSLALGATLGVVALMTGQWMLLPVIAIIPISTTLSVILQVGYFKLTGGKRLFKMAPLHHHFELSGWSETQIVQRFWLIGLIAAMIGVALACRMKQDLARSTRSHSWSRPSGAGPGSVSGKTQRSGRD